MKHAHRAHHPLDPRVERLLSLRQHWYMPKRITLAIGLTGAAAVASMLIVFADDAEAAPARIAPVEICEHLGGMQRCAERGPISVDLRISRDDAIRRALDVSPAERLGWAVGQAQGNALLVATP